MTKEEVITLGSKVVSGRVVIEQTEMGMELHAHSRNLRIYIPPRCPQEQKNHEEGCQLRS